MPFAEFEHPGIDEVREDYDRGNEEDIIHDVKDRAGEAVIRQEKNHKENGIEKWKNLYRQCDSSQYRHESVGISLSCPSAPG
jgi:hypothetical protein